MKKRNDKIRENLKIIDKSFYLNKKASKITVIGLIIGSLNKQPEKYLFFTIFSKNNTKEMRIIKLLTIYVICLMSQGYVLGGCSKVSKKVYSLLPVLAKDKVYAVRIFAKFIINCLSGGYSKTDYAKVCFSIQLMNKDLTGFLEPAYNSYEAKYLAYRAMDHLDNNYLFELLYNSVENIRMNAFGHLSLRGSIEIFNKMVMLSSSKNIYVRAMAACVLGQLKNSQASIKKQSLSILLKLLLDESAYVRAFTASSISHFCNDEVLISVESALLKATWDVDKYVRDCAATSLMSARRTETVLSRLIELLDDPYEDVRYSAEDSIDYLVNYEHDAAIHSASQT